MSQAYTADTPFRLAVMGDSWVTDVKRSRSGHVVRSPMGEALCHSVTQTLGAVEFFVAGFPGARTENLLDLCHTTTIRNAAHLSAECHSLKRGTAKQCHLAGLPTFEDALSVEGENAPDMQESIDVAVLIIGSNDLLYDGASADCIVENILAMKHALNDRGVEVLVCTLSAQQLGRAAQKVRKAVNTQLRSMDFVVDLDPFFRSQDMRTQNWHLNSKGYKSLGDFLGRHILTHFDHSKPDSAGDARNAIQVTCSGTSFKARLISGTYTETETTNPNQKVYQKIGKFRVKSRKAKDLKAGKAPKIYLFESPKTSIFQGWWIGPDPELKETAWACIDQNSWDQGKSVISWWTFGPGLPRLPAPPSPYFDISVLKPTRKRRHISEEQWTCKVERRRQMLDVKYPQWRYYPRKHYHESYYYSQYNEIESNHNEWNDNEQIHNAWNDQKDEMNTE